MGREGLMPLRVPLLLFCLSSLAPQAALGADLPAAPTPTTPVSQALPTWRLPSTRVHGHKPEMPAAELDPTAPANVLTGDDLRDHHLSVPEALDAQAGLKVQQLSGFGAPALLSVRGCSSEQVEVYIDDVPLQSLDGTPLDLADLPSGQIERMEVYRGMTPAALGSQSVGGTLRLTLRQPNGVGGEVNAGMGSYGARQTEAAAAWANDSLRFSGGIRWLHADGNFPFHFDNGTLYDKSDDAIRQRQNNALDRLGGTFGGRWQISKRWSLQGRWFGAGLQEGIPGPALFESATANLRRDRQLSALSLLGENIWRQDDRLRVSVQGSWLGTDVSDPRGELGVPWQTSQTVRALGVQAVWQTPIAGPLSAVTRLSATAGDVATHDFLAGLDQPPSTRQALQAGLGLPLAWPDLGLQLVPSASVEGQHSRRTTNESYPFTTRELSVGENALWTARLAGSWQALSWLQPRVAWTRGTRAPTLMELYGNDGVIRGNPLLAPETAMTWDLGAVAKYEAERWTIAVDASVFYKQVDNLIQLAAVNAHQARYDNIASAELYGLEVQASTRLFKQLRITGQHTTLVAEDTSGRPAYDGKALPMRPRTHWALRADWLRRTGPLAWRPFVTAQWQAGHFLDEANLVVVPPQTLLGGGLRIEHKPWQVFAELRVDNALDASVVDLVGYPLPGRTFWLQIGWRLWRDDDAPRPNGDKPEALDLTGKADEVVDAPRP
jgi:outer membrane cobalamin receptor